jgi:hypothetical protein
MKKQLIIDEITSIMNLFDEPINVDLNKLNEVELVDYLKNINPSYFDLFLNKIK